MSLRDEFHSNYEKNFFADVTITTAPLEQMLYDSRHAQDRSWAGIRRISHGTAIRHQHPLCPGLQLGRNRPEPRLNLDLCRSLLCTADGFLSLFGFRPITCSTNKPLIAGTPSAWSAGATAG